MSPKQYVSASISIISTIFFAAIKAICFNIYLIKKWCQLISFDTHWLEPIRENPIDNPEKNPIRNNEKIIWWEVTFDNTDFKFRFLKILRKILFYVSQQNHQRDVLENFSKDFMWRIYFAKYGSKKINPAFSHAFLVDLQL